MSARRLAAIVWVAAAACRSKDAAPSVPLDARPIAQLTKGQLDDELQRARRGDAVGEPLRAPRVVITPGEILVNDLRAVDRGALPGVAGDGALHTWMRGLAEHYHRVHDAPMIPAADVSLPASTPTDEAAVLLDAVARAGYADGILLRAGTATARLKWGRSSDAHVLGATVGIAREGGGWKVGRAAYDAFTCASARAATPADVASLIDELCVQQPGREHCVDVVVSGAADVAEAVTILGPAMQAHALAGAWVTFAPRARCTPAGFVRVGPAWDVRGARFTGHAGELPQEVVSRELRRQVFPVFRACYEIELVKDPKLRGEVDLAFAIDGAGAVVDKRLVRSDLGSAAVESCLFVQLDFVRFPAPSAGRVEVDLPLELTTRE